MSTFTKKQFITWLRAQHPKRRFLFSSSGDCVFASFAREVLALESFECQFGNGSTNFHVGHEVLPFPHWANAFCHSLKGTTNYINVERVLKLLNK